jgi:heterodisulfide reductase subunit A-like polyferredoxin
VVGGGVAGVRCSLDLAEAGHKVCLVEKSTALGGHATRIDKVFPHNKCSVCTITPKLKSAAQNPDIEILTNATLAGLEGDAGAFTARIRRQPLFVDPKVCTNCGDCAEACPVVITDRYNDGLVERKAIGKLYQHAIPNTHTVIKAGHSPCKRACPVHTSAQGYIDLIAAERFAEAYAIAAESNPFPAVCGRICDHDCETACVRGEVDEPIAIASLKRFIADWAAEQLPLPAPAGVRHNEKIAVIGAGPAGLTAARDLAALGYGVTVFEALPEPGGMLRYGVPEFRLPKEALRSDIERITALGVEVRCDQAAGRDFTVDGLLADGYHAVFIATGRQEERDEPLTGSDLTGVVSALDLLRQITQGGLPEIGGRVVVAGDDDVALDAARTCLRLGATSVTLAAGREVTDLAATAENLSEAVEEGIEIVSGLLPVAVLGTGSASAVKFQRCVPGGLDEHGRRQALPVAGGFVELACDTAVLPALPSPAGDVVRSSEGLERERGRILADETTLATGRPGVFAGGDAVSPAGSWSAIEAIAAGRRAARSIHAHLRGEESLSLSDDVMDEARPSAAALEAAEVITRVPMSRIAASERRTDWREVATGYTEEQAVAEASRCLDCAVCGECRACITACKPGALRHDARDQELTRDIGAVVLAMGFGNGDFSRYERYGYGRYANVISSFGYERMLSPNGPTFSELVRPSDGAHPRRIAFIKPLYPHETRPYTCTNICDMYSTKEGMLARDHLTESDCDVFSVEKRPIGKGFEDFHKEALARGVRYVAAQPSSVREDPATGDLLVHWQDERGERHMSRYDLVVLSLALEPPSAGAELAAALGVDLDENGFCATDDLAPVLTSRPGVFVAGAFSGPKDIPRSMAQASAAAAHAMITARDGDAAAAAPKSKPPQERDVAEEQPRVGVFVCRCDEMPRVVDVDDTADFVATIPSVAFSAAVDHACRADGLAFVREQIVEQRLNRVVVAGCSPRVKEPVFQGALRQAGLNPFLLEMANIREQVAWAHATREKEATAKAKSLVRMAVARAELLRPLHKTSVPVTQAALVIGGGIAGMTAALTLSEIGHPVHLIERSARLGGHALDPDTSTVAATAAAHAQGLMRRLVDEPAVQVHLEADLIESKGFAGNFISTVETSDGERTRIDHGATVVATGAREDRPGLYGLGENPGVMTQSDLAALLAAKSPRLDPVRDVTMVLCAGTHNESIPCCSQASCAQAITNAVRLKERGAHTVTVWHRETWRYGVTEGEGSLRHALESGIVFRSYAAGNEPRVRLPEGVVAATPAAATDKAESSSDLLAITTPTVPNDGNERLAATLRVPLAADGFFSLSDRDLDPDANLLPVDFIHAGIFLCGAAEYPKTLAETISQAHAAAGRAAAALATPTVTVGGSVSEVDQDKCTACLTCVRVCPVSVPVIDPAVMKATIEPTVCKGCGICVSQCPVKAITLHHYTDTQILATEQALFTEVS